MMSLYGKSTQLLQASYCWPSCIGAVYVMLQMFPFSRFILTISNAGWGPRAGIIYKGLLQEGRPCPTTNVHHHQPTIVAIVVSSEPALAMCAVTLSTTTELLQRMIVGSNSVVFVIANTIADSIGSHCAMSGYVPCGSCTRDKPRCTLAALYTLLPVVRHRCFLIVFGHGFMR